MSKWRYGLIVQDLLPFYFTYLPDKHLRRMKRNEQMSEYNTD
jgi:hypothetical protein